MRSKKGMSSMKKMFKSFVALVLAFIMLVPGQALAAIDLSVDSGLVTYLQFEGNTTDSSVSNKGILYTSSSYNLGTLAYEAGIHGNAVRVPYIDTGDARSNVIRLNNGIITSDLATSVWSLSIWVNPDELTSDTSVFYSWRTNQTLYLMPGGLTDGDGTPTLRIWDRGRTPNVYYDFVAPSSMGLTEGEWAMLTITYDKYKVNFYVNGKLADSKDITGIQYAPVGSGSQQYYIGGDDVNGSFDGLIDDFMLYNAVALTEAQIEEIYKEQLNSNKILTGIEVGTNPTKTEYEIGEALELTGLTVVKKYSDGTTEAIPAADYEVTGFDSTQAGTKTVSVTAYNKTVTFEVKVKIDANAVLDNIAIATNPTKTTYSMGEELDFTGIAVKANYDDGSSEIITDYDVTKYDRYAVGTQAVEISYGGKTTELNITVTESRLVAINFDSGSIVNSIGNSFGLYDTTSTSYNQGIYGYENGLTGQGVTIAGNGGSVSSDIIRLSDKIIQKQENYSISMWGKSDTLTEGQGIFFTRRSAHYIKVIPGGINGNNVPTVVIYDNNQGKTFYLTADTALTPGEWAMFTLKCVDKKMYFYINGEKACDPLDLTSFGSFLPIGDTSSQRYYLGGIPEYDASNGNILNNEDSNIYDGVIDNFEIYNIALSDDAVKELFVKQLDSNVILTGIELTSSPTKTEYEIGEDLELAGLSIVKKYSNGTTEAVPSGDYEVTGYNSNQTGTQTITVTAYNKSVTFEVKVNENENAVLESIEITTLPTKVSYSYGEDLNFTGMVVKAYYDDNSSKIITDYIVTKYDRFAIGNQLVEIKYGDKTIEFEVEVSESRLVAINFDDGSIINSINNSYGLNSSALYNIGSYTYEDGVTGSAVKVGATSGNISTNLIRLSDIIIEKDDGYTISLWVNPTSLNDHEGVFYVRRTSHYLKIVPGGINDNGVPTVELYNANSSRTLTLEAASELTPGEWAMLTVTSVGKKIHFYVNGIEVCSPVDISGWDYAPIGSTGSQRFYLGGIPEYGSQSESLNGHIKKEEAIKDGVIFDGLIDNFTIFNIALGDAGVSELYTEQQRVVTGLEIKTEPTKTTYYTGDKIDTEGMVVIAKYADGYERAVYDYTTSGFDSNPDTAAPSQAITVHYAGFTGTFDISMIKTGIKSIRFASLPNQVTYNKGDSFKTRGMVVYVEYNNGTEAKITDYVISGYNANKVGTQTITVTYEGKTATFDIVVNDIYITSISIYKNPSKTVYYLGESFNGKGLIVSANYNNGTADDITGYQLSGFSSKTTGTKTIKVTYQGKTTSFKVTVKKPSITLTKKSATIYTKGTKSVTLKVKSIVGSSKKVTWKTSDPKKATVSSSGKVTAKKAGKVTITATANGAKTTATVYIKKPTIKVKKGSKTLKNKAKIVVKQNKKVTLKVTVTPKATVKYTVTNKQIVSVKKGVIKGLKKGSTTIKVKSLGITKTFTVTVK